MHTPDVLLGYACNLPVYGRCLQYYFEYKLPDAVWNIELQLVRLMDDTLRGFLFEQTFYGFLILKIVLVKCELIVIVKDFQTVFF